MWDVLLLAALAGASPLSALKILYPVESEVLPDAMEGFAYQKPCEASPASPGIVWTATGLPSGLTIAGLGSFFEQFGSIDGTPAAGSGGKTYNVNILADDGMGGRDSVNVTLAVYKPVQFKSTGALGTVPLGVSYSKKLQVTGGYVSMDGSLSFSISSGSLPPGFSFDAATGVLSGTPLTPGNYAFQVTVKDEWSTPTTDTLSCTIKCMDPFVTTSAGALPNALSGTPYSTALQATGGMAPHTWSVAGLPPSFTVSVDGVISGTPNVSDVGLHTLKASVTDSDVPPTTITTALTFDVQPTELVILTASSLPASESGVPYSVALQATGGVAPYTWNVTGLPTSLVVAANGVISGTPDEADAGVYALKAAVTDSYNLMTSTNTVFSLVIAAEGKAPLSITTSFLPVATEGESYSQTLAAAGGDASYAWLVTGLPTGLVLDGDTIVGTPADASQGTYYVSALVTGAEGETANTILTLVVESAAQTTQSEGGAESGGIGGFTPNLVGGATAAGCSMTSTTGSLWLWLVAMVLHSALFVVRRSGRVRAWSR
ncbi:MAG: Ig domain-containing protein [Planctomycetes bacterium]|nr:Ig domain-containing protein [Planctomycetota bacterium]NUQ34966.1 putative Ig domain-containing protein [Planctomycetaceae bacterium]